MRKTIFIFILLALFSCTEKSTEINQKADIVYFGGDIITMEGSEPVYAEAIAVTNGEIIYVGTKEGAEKLIYSKTKKIDLQGKTLLPGFIDAHGHVSGYGMVSQVPDLSPPPYGAVSSIPDLQNVLRKYIADNKSKLPKGTPILANGYDDAIMEEHLHPTAEQLDEISTEYPIYIEHASGHMGVGNSAFLKLLKVDYTSPNPEGGFMGRDDKTKKLTGKMTENANIIALVTCAKLMKQEPKSEDQKFDALLAAEKEWFKNGQTTICDGRSAPDNIELIREADSAGLLLADFVVLPDYDMNKQDLDELKKYYDNKEGHFKIGAIKMTFDGSPQGKSAWLTEPYLIPPDGQDAGFKGEPIYTEAAAYEGLKDIFSHGMRTHIHCNGDAAIDLGFKLIDSLKQEGLYTPNLRCVLVHSQVTRPDQVHLFKELGVMPSWFPTHVYLWGDWHVSSVLGINRASHISPLNDGLRAGIMFTIHHDSPVTPPDLLTAVYAAVNRVTRSGKLLGGDQRISPYDALKAITINAAYQWNEENRKGSLKIGKIADFVILDKNPLKVNPLEIKDIKVSETIKEGRSVYKK